MEAKMLSRNYKKKSKVLVSYLYLFVCILVLSLTGNTNNLFSQDISENDQQAALMQYTLKYRFTPDLKVGDWIKYNAITGEGVKDAGIELKITGEEKGNFWIEEKFQGVEVQYLVDLKQMKLIKAKGVDETGSEFELTLLSDEKLDEIMGMFKVQMEQQGSYAQFISWKEGEKTEEVVIPAGTFNCVYLRPEYSEQYAKQIEDYEKLLRDQGKTDAEIDAAVYGNEPRLYFCDDVPKMLPMQIAIGWVPYIEAFEEITGGLIECKHMSPIRLTGYGGQ